MYKLICRLFAFVVSIMLLTNVAHAQKDTTKKNTTDTSAIKKAVIVKPNGINNPPVGTIPTCSVLGPSSVAPGQIVYYTVMCDAEANLEWHTSYGTIIQSYAGAVVVQWDYPCIDILWASLDGQALNSVQQVMVFVTANEPLFPGLITSGNQTVNSNGQVSAISASIPTGGACAGAYNYQWQSSTDNSTWNNISGATNVDYSTAPLATTTHFRRQVTCGDVTQYTDVATVTVLPELLPGSISVSNAYINYGQSPGTINGASASGGDGSYTYEWLTTTDPNGEWSLIAGAGGASYTPGALSVSTYFMRQVISNGAMTRTAPLLITVYPTLTAGSISAANSIINYNTDAGVINGIAATGGSGSYTYQWFSSPDNVSWQPIAGANSTSYSPGVITNTTYYIRNVSSNGVTLSSNSIGITVYPQLQGGSIYADNNVINYGTSPGIIHGAVATGGNGNYTYQWYYSPDNVSWQLIGGANGIDYLPGSLTSTTYFIRNASSNGITVVTNSIAITVYAQLQAGDIYTNINPVNYNSSPGTIYSISPTGGNGIYNYQWYKAPDGVSWQAISGANGDTYTPGNLTEAIFFLRQVNSNGVVVNSPALYIDVYPELQSGYFTSSSPVYVNYGTSPGTITAAEASGGDGNYSYQWYSSTDAANWSPIYGETGQNYSPGELYESVFYRRSVTNNGVTANLDYIYVHVYDEVYPGTVEVNYSESQYINYNTSPGTILNRNNPSGGNGSYTYQWYSSIDNVNWQAINGATGSGYAPANLTVTTYYQREVNSNGFTGRSNTVSIYVYPQLNAGSISAGSLYINYNTDAGTINGTAASGGNSSYNYQWYNSTDNASWHAINGAIGVNYSPGVLTSSTYYLRQVSSNGVAVNAASLLVTVYPQLGAGSISAGSSYINYNTDAGTINGASANGGNGSYSYQWYRSTDNTSWQSINGATGINYSPGVLISSTYYLRQVNSNGVAANATSVLITVYPQLGAGSISAGSPYINYNTDAGTINGASANGGDGSYNYQWYRSTDNTSWQPINGATGVSYSPGVLTSSTYYLRQVNSNGVVVNAASVLITVYPQLVAGSTSTGTPYINYNSDAGTINGTPASGGNGSYSYQWYSSTDNSSWQSLSGATGVNYSPGVLTSSTYYLRQVNSNGVIANATSVLITVYPQLQAPVFATENISINFNSSPGTLSCAPASGGNGTITYQWQSSANGTAWSDVNGIAGLSFSPGVLTQPVFYRVIAVSGGVSVISNTLKVTVYRQVSGGTIKVGNGASEYEKYINYNTSLVGVYTRTEATGGDGVYTYLWQKSTDGTNWQDIANSNTVTYLSAELLHTTTYYRRSVTSNGVSAYSNIATVYVYPALNAGTITPSAAAVNYNTEAGIINADAASGGSGVYTYQWYSSVDNNNWTVTVGAQDVNYNPGVVTTSKYYQRKVTSNGVSLLSNTVFIQVYPQLVSGTLSPASQVIPYGQNVSVITLSGTSGGNGLFTYQWQSSEDKGTWSNITGATSLSYTPSVSAGAIAYFRVLVTSNGAVVYSGASQVQAYGSLHPGTLPDTMYAYYRTDPGIIPNTAATGGDGNYSYQWELSGDNVNYNTLSGKTSQDLDPGDIWGSGYFRRKVTSQGVTLYTNPVYMIMYDLFTVGNLDKTDMVVASGQNAQPITAELPSGADGNYVYQWQRWTTGGDWIDVTGANAISYTPLNVTESAKFRLKVSSLGMTKYTNICDVYVMIVTVDQPSHAIVSYNTNGGQLTSHVNGISGSVNYQWQMSTDNANWNSVANATDYRFVTPNLTVKAYFRLSVNAYNTTVFSNTVVIDVYPPLAAGNVSPKDISIQPGNSPGVLTATPATGGTGNYSYQWQVSGDNIGWSDLGNAYGLTFNAPTENNVGTVYYRLSVYDGNEFSRSNPVRIQVKYPLTGGTISPATTTVPYNTSPGLTFNVSGVTGGSCNNNFIYYWQSSTDGVNFIYDYDSTASLEIPGTLTQTTYIRRAVICNDDTTYSSVAVINVQPAFNPGYILVQAQTVLPNTVASTIEATAATNGNCSNYQYQWQQAKEDEDFADIPGPIGQNLQYNEQLSVSAYFRRKVICDTLTGYTNIHFVKVDSPFVYQYPKTIIDIVLDSTGIRTDSLFGMPKDSIANNRYVDSLLYNADSISAEAQHLLMLNAHKLESSQITAIMSAPIADSSLANLDVYNQGGVGGDSSFVYIPIITDSLFHAYVTNDNLFALDSLARSGTDFGFEEVKYRLIDSLMAEDTAQQQLLFKPASLVQTQGLIFTPTILIEKLRNIISIRSAVISGPTLVLRGTTARYTAKFASPLLTPYVRWVINGGAVVAQNTNPATGEIYVDVRWNSSQGVPYVALMDIPSGQFQIMTVSVVQSVLFIPEIYTNAVLPAFQKLFNGSVPALLTVQSNKNPLYTYTYQWQKIELYGDKVWNNIAGATGETYQPPAFTGVWNSYRRIATETTTLGGSSSITSTIASIQTQDLNPGQIRIRSAVVKYNTVPQITADDATGGYLPPDAHYNYAWEVSTNGINWQVIGNDAAFPSTYAIREPYLKVRRKVSVVANDMLFINALPTNYTKVVTTTLDLTSFYQTVDFENKNYVRENTILTRGVVSWEDADALPVGQKQQSTTYLDGLGRSIQTVDKATHAIDANETGWYDFVTTVKYEAGGIVYQQPLAYPSKSNPGKYKDNVAAEQAAYYQSKFQDTHPYSKVDYDGSPLNRVNKSYAPGDSWVGANIGQQVIYDQVIPFEYVYRWKMGVSDGDLPVFLGSANSAIAPLTKMAKLDEKGKKSIVYRDHSGKIILTKTQSDESVSDKDYTGWLCTYNIYDDLDRLKYVVTPKGVKELEANYWQLSQTIVDELCFVYEYDDLGRVVSKKTPGKGKEYFVYDKRNRPVMTQDANQRAKATPEWLINVYDPLNRVIATGVYKSQNTRDKLQILANNAPSVSTIQLPGTSIPMSPALVVQVSNYPLASNTFDNSANGYILKYNFYDNYLAIGDQQFKSDMPFAYKDGDVEPNIKTQRTEGVATVSKTRVLDNNFSNSRFLQSSYYYDESGSVIQTQSTNITGGNDITGQQYHFDGRQLSHLSIHTASGTSFANFPILTKYNYDRLGVLMSIGKKINNNARNYVNALSINNGKEDDNAGYKTISKYISNELGQGVQKILSPGWNSGAGLETIDYDYNIRGWLTGINKNYALGEYNSNQWDHFFGTYLGYDNKDGKFNQARLDGKITGTIWKSQGDNTPRKYDYQYDNVGRLIEAQFNQKDATGGSWNKAKVDFSVKELTYDENSNILSMTNMGILPGAAAPVAIDKLTYLYKPKSNVLLRVDDAASSGNMNGRMGDFKDGNNAAGTDDYVYDANGNIINDYNRGVQNGTQAGVVYNYLDLPESIHIDGKGDIQYIYDANGHKLQKKVIDNSTTSSPKTTTTTYLGDYVYQATDDNNGSSAMQLQSIDHEEGRIRIVTPYENANDPTNVITGGIILPDNKQGIFDYFIKDQLSNVRSIITEEINKASATCSMEDADNVLKQKEEVVFGNPSNNEVVATRVVRPVDWTAIASTGPNGNNQKVSKLQAVGGVAKVGPNVLLRVMAGDQIAAKVDYYYAQNPGNTGSSTGLNALVQSLASTVTGDKATAIIKGNMTGWMSTLANAAPVQSFFNNTNDDANLNAPKAYLNWVFLDEQMNFVSTVSGFKRVSQAGDGATPLVMNITKALKNGYVYVYLSNESGEPVYFDNLAVSHERGRLIEDDHYYAYGLKIAGISSRSVSSSLQDKEATHYGYQGEFSEELNDFDLNYNEFQLRMYDPQVGRWTTADPFDQFASPYLGMGADPVNSIDPNGGYLFGLDNAFQQAVTTAVGGMFVGAMVGAFTGGNERDIFAGAAVGGLLGFGGSFGLSGLTISSSSTAVGLLYAENTLKAIVNGEHYRLAPVVSVRVDDDIITIDTKTKTAVIDETDDLLDVVSVDGGKRCAEEAGITEKELKSKGYKILHPVANGTTTSDFASSLMFGRLLKLLFGSTSRQPLTSAEKGRIIGWGEGNTTQGVQKTLDLTVKLTKRMVRGFKRAGLDKEWVERQLKLYNNAIQKGGTKLKNEQLLPRKALMEKILDLWE